METSYTVAAPDGSDLELPRRLPLLPLRDVVVFPSMVTPLLVGRPASVAAVEAAMERDKLLCVIAQRDARDRRARRRRPLRRRHGHPGAADHPHPRRDPEDPGRGRGPRARGRGLRGRRPTSRWTSTRMVETFAEGTEVEALSRSIKERFKEYVRLNKRLPDEVLLSVLNLDEIARMTDSISAYILGKVPLKQDLLEEPSLATPPVAHQPGPGQRAGHPGDRAAHRLRGAEPGPAQPARVLPQRAAAGHPQGAGLHRRRGHRGRGVHASASRTAT